MESQIKPAIQANQMPFRYLFPDVFEPDGLRRQNQVIAVSGFVELVGDVTKLAF